MSGIHCVFNTPFFSDGTMQLWQTIIIARLRITVPEFSPGCNVHTARVQVLFHQCPQATSPCQQPLLTTFSNSQLTIAVFYPHHRLPTTNV